MESPLFRCRRICLTRNVAVIIVLIITFSGWLFHSSGNVEPKSVVTRNIDAPRSPSARMTQGNDVQVNEEAFYMHYIRFLPDNGNKEFRFIDYLSVMSAVQYLRPDEIIVHGDFEPTGKLC